MLGTENAIKSFPATFFLGVIAFHWKLKKLRNLIKTVGFFLIATQKIITQKN